MGRLVPWWQTTLSKIGDFLGAIFDILAAETTSTPGTHVRLHVSDLKTSFWYSFLAEIALGQKSTGPRLWRCFPCKTGSGRYSDRLNKGNIAILLNILLLALVCDLPSKSCVQCLLIDLSTSLIAILATGKINTDMDSTYCRIVSHTKVVWKSTLSQNWRLWGHNQVGPHIPALDQPRWK